MENKYRKCIHPNGIPTPKNLDTREKVDQFLDNNDCLMLDCDGVLWCNDDVITDVPSVVDKLRLRGKKIIYATNNSTKTREELMEKLNTLGFHASLDEVFTTSYTTAIYLKAIQFDRKVFVVGSSGIVKELEKVGIRSIGLGPDPTPGSWAPGYASVKLDPEVGAVVVGFDNHISFPKLVKACSYAKRADCLFVAANADESYPSPNSEMVVPGPGSTVAAIQAVCNKEVIPLGKPYPFFWKCIRKIHPYIDPKRTVMIGDRLTTDILFGKNIGIRTLFVESGLCSYEDMNNMLNSGSNEDHLCVPDYYMKSLAAFDKYM